jgi:hypothetical protein
VENGEDGFDSQEILVISENISLEPIISLCIFENESESSGSQ